MLGGNCLIAVVAAIVLGGCAYHGDRDDYVVGASADYQDTPIRGHAKPSSDAMPKHP